MNTYESMIKQHEQTLNNLEWSYRAEMGSIYEMVRSFLGDTKTFTAGVIGVSRDTIRRLEQGYPVKHRSLVLRAYSEYLMARLEGGDLGSSLDEFGSRLKAKLSVYRMMARTLQSLIEDTWRVGQNLNEDTDPLVRALCGHFKSTVLERSYVYAELAVVCEKFLTSLGEA